MNCPTRDPDPKGVPGFNQQPPQFDNELNSNKSFNKNNSTAESGKKLSQQDIANALGDDLAGGSNRTASRPPRKARPGHQSRGLSESSLGIQMRRSTTSLNDGSDANTSDDSNESTPLTAAGGDPNKKPLSMWANMMRILSKYGKFVGPGIMVSVAYMDPGNYSTAVSAGAMYQYKLLFIIFVSNLFAVFLQVLCVKLGSVTGLDLAENCRRHLPPWLSVTIYVMAEIAIIATDLAEVVGTAISLNILFGIPLFMGVLVTVVDVLIVLMAYRPNGPMRIVRYFEYAVAALVAVVVVCFAFELAAIDNLDIPLVLEGFLPSKELLETQGLYLSCGILGATVMPHSLYLGSGLVQPRLREYDEDNGYAVPQDAQFDEDDDDLKYKPSIHAIKYAMKYSIAELVISLFTVAIFINSAILIVAGSTLNGSPDAYDADLFSIYDMLRTILSPAAGTVFALALLFSGQSAGIVCTLSGQMVSEGFLRWSFKPWIRRLITRSIAIVPCLFVTLFVGRKGLADVLNASQVVLSLLLPIVSAPLIYFTGSKKIMKVAANAAVINHRPRSNSNGTLTPADRPSGYGMVDEASSDEESICIPEYVDMSNSATTQLIAYLVFGLVSALNLFLIISIAMGADVPL
ncbi:Manganese transporter SMF2 [Yarrowia sp. B02]|nr:Manganese transporter SMF2 [Yarrowia sp. B02]